MPLTDAAIRAAKPKLDQKTTKLSDGGGLFLQVERGGGRLWRLAYRFNGKQKLLALGSWPAVSLRAARSQRGEAKSLLASGVDPGRQRKAEKLRVGIAATNTFALVTRELIEKKRREGKTAATVEKNEWVLSFALPILGERPIGEIGSPDVLAALRKVEERGRHETARRLRALVGQVFRYAVATGRASGDPTVALHGAITAPVVRHRPAITNAADFGGLLRAIDGYRGDGGTRIALQLLALTFVRPGELRNAAWPEFDLDAAVWIVPAARMKMRREHRIPLTRQAIKLLEELRPLTGRYRLLFPGQRTTDRAISENTLNGALRRLGYTQDQMTAHGFRAAASSILNESGKFNPDAIEAQLAHQEADAVRRAYKRAQYWDERVRMMRWWADRCDELKHGGSASAS
jgi:integrase